MLDAMIDRLLVTFSPRRQRAAVRRIAEKGDREAAESLIKIAQGGFYEGGYSFASAQLDALEGLGDIRGDGEPIAYKYLTDITRHYQAGKLHVRKTMEFERENSSRYSVSCKLTFPGVGGRLGKQTYVIAMKNLFGISSGLTDEARRSFSIGIMEFTGRDLFKKGGTYVDNFGLQASEACEVIYAGIRKLETAGADKA